MYHGEEDGFFSQGAHGLVESETETGNDYTHNGVSALLRGNIDDLDEGRVGSLLREPLLGYLNLKLHLGGGSKMVG